MLFTGTFGLTSPYTSTAANFSFTPVAKLVFAIAGLAMIMLQKK
jgi:hypothetical protein